MSHRRRGRLAIASGDGQCAPGWNCQKIDISLVRGTLRLSRLFEEGAGRRNRRIDDNQIGIDKIAFEMTAQMIRLDRAVGDLGQRADELVSALKDGHRHPRTRREKADSSSPPPKRPSPMTVTRRPVKLIAGAKSM